ncbi:MAG: GNAT family N-acetyltransferase [Pelomonas sp.]|nr:GNAT family N-acetyltransferase [Roseateles sp.]
MWNALSGPLAHISVGGASVRKLAPGFSPIVAFADPGQPDFAALAELCAPDEPFYVENWRGAGPAGWRIEAEATMVKMYFAGEIPTEDDFPQAIALGAEHAPQMLELALLMRPGPFGLRTVEMGDYFGVIEGGELVAMAGERLRAGSLREISGVATRPGHQGRGLARRLMAKLVRRQLARGEQPVLHVMSANAVARALYTRQGWREHREVPVRVVVREA